MGSPALSIKLRCASWQQLAVIYKRDLCRQQLFLKTQTPPPIGTQVRIDLTLPSETTVSMSGEIMGHVPPTDSRGGGIDVRLQPLAPNSMWLIESALASETKLQKESKSDASAALSDRHEVAHAEGELVSALSSEIESLRRLNPFQVLGLGYEASDADVRAAFAELTKRYHPDRFARYQSPEPRRMAAEIFILIRDAYRKLGDPQTRAATLAAIGRIGDPRAIPVMRTGAVPAASRSGGSQGIARAAIPARGEASPPAGTPLASSAGSPASGPHAAPSSAAASPAASGSAPHSTSATSATSGTSGTSGTSPTAPASAPRSAPQPQPQPSVQAGPGVRGASGSGPSIKAIGDVELAHLEQLLDAEAYDEALATFRSLAKRAPSDRHVRAGIDLCEGFLALAARDRLEAAQKFESVLEIDPSNERAARQLAEMRRQATNERKGLLSRLMGKKE